MIKCVIWSSVMDYPDNICTTLLTGTCNFDCEFCYNKGLSKEKQIDFEKEILPKLLERKSFIDHIIISGGECTVSKDFEEIIDKLYENGFKIGIHTNGYESEIIHKVIKKLDYIAMDIKNDFSNYEKITGRPIAVGNIQKTIDVIVNSGVKYEFKTTVYPKYVKKDNLVNIAKYLNKVGAKNYTLQNYFDYNKTVNPYSEMKLKQIQNECNMYVPTVLKGIV